MDKTGPKDRNGRSVTVGARVRIVSLSESFLNSLPEEEVNDVRSMVGEVFEVYEIDQYGSPWVGKGWENAETGDYRGHSVALDPEEMEVVEMSLSSDALRDLYRAPQGRALKKQLDHLDRHCRRFIELSPFVVIASAAGNGCLDASPRGGNPGFIKVVSETTLWIPDSPGNNRLDSLLNITETGRIGLLFLIPGVHETLRVNGSAHVTAAPEKTIQFASEKRVPRVIVEVAVEEAYLHCGKAFMRSKLWARESRQDRAVLPSLGQMINDQTGERGPAETQDAMIARYEQDL